MFWYLLALARYTLGSLLLFFLFFLSKRIRKRRAYERRWPLVQRDYEVWLHASSEGELEQLVPLIDALEARKVLTLLLVTSPSLEKKLKDLSESDYREVAVLPLNLFFPFGSKSLFSLKVPKSFYMVRYDFFIELMIAAFRCENSVLLSATLKGKNFKGHGFKKLIFNLIYGTFNKIYAASPVDLERFEDFGLKSYQKLEQFDFRHGQILKRQDLKENLHRTHCCQSLEKILKPYAREKRLIFGSLWELELELFNEDFIEAMKRKEVFVFLAPHHLKGEQWDALFTKAKEWQEKGLEITYWDQMGIRGEGNIILCKVPGLLCELYPYFGHAFVGGGHGRSVHSLLEPFWGCDHIYCGPKTHRSTEADFVQDQCPEYLHIVRELSSFYSIYQKNCDAKARDCVSLRTQILTEHSRHLEVLSHTS